MAFKVINNTAKRYQPKPEGNYIRMKDGRDWMITEITISASGHVCLKLTDLDRYENQIVKACTIEDLVGQIDGAQFIIY